MGENSRVILERYRETTAGPSRFEPILGTVLKQEPGRRSHVSSAGRRARPFSKPAFAKLASAGRKVEL